MDVAFNPMSCISDGQKMLLFLNRDTPLVLDDYFITNVGYSYLINEGCNIDITLRCSHPVMGQVNLLDYKFAVNMTVRELLESVGNKIKSRE